MRCDVSAANSKESNNTLYIVRGNEGGKPCWHKVLVDPEKEEAFLKQVSIGSMYCPDYGKVLCSGWGEYPK